MYYRRIKPAGTRSITTQ